MVLNKVIEGYLRRKWLKILIDSALLVGFLAEFITREGPNYDVHSWVGIVLMPIIALHLFSNVGWIKRVWARKRKDREFSLGVLNAAFGALAFVCILTGFPIWLELSDASAWSGVHTVTGFASIILMFAHLWKNRTRIVGLVKQ